MSVKSYQVIYEGGVGEITEKKSRFIATVRKVEAEEEAVSFINEMKKTYWDARHNCSAFVIGGNNELTRCNDDGEPSGTAGRPMLDVLVREDVHNVAVVVTRYFGGVLLGTGGLVRAYQAAVQEGLKNSKLMLMQEGYPMEVTTDYNGLGKIQYYLRNQEIPTGEIIYGEGVTIPVVVPTELKEEVIKNMTECTNGSAKIQVSDPLMFGLLENKIIF